MGIVCYLKTSMSIINLAIICADLCKLLFLPSWELSVVLKRRAVLHPNNGFGYTSRKVAQETQSLWLGLTKHRTQVGIIIWFYSFFFMHKVRVITHWSSVKGSNIHFLIKWFKYWACGLSPIRCYVICSKNYSAMSKSRRQW